MIKWQVLLLLETTEIKKAKRTADRSPQSLLQSGEAPSQPACLWKGRADSSTAGTENSQATALLMTVTTLAEMVGSSPRKINIMVEGRREGATQGECLLSATHPRCRPQPEDKGAGYHGQGHEGTRLKGCWNICHNRLSPAALESKIFRQNFPIPKDLLNSWAFNIYLF